ncbi:PH domain-containing protein [Melissospora conviva]|uniref:PH domain-containing protein n=1 Tax=Melissospora conviva TaxID=3388432 RepID=UPI003B7D9BD5
MTDAPSVRIRHNQAIVAAAVIAFFGTMPLAGARWYLLPLLLVPLAVIVWAWRAGTDADLDGLRVRALLGSSLLPWSRISEVAADERGRGLARLVDGTVVPLPAVRRSDLPAIAAASGNPLPEPQPQAAQ